MSYSAHYACLTPANWHSQFSSASKPLWLYVILWICYHSVHSDERVLNFISNIRHRLQSIHLKINFWNFNGNEEKCAFFRQLLAMLADKISILSMAKFIDFDRNFPGIIDAVQTIENEDYVYEEICDFFFQWLLKRQSDGKQKRLKLWTDIFGDYYDQLCAFIRRIKEEFFCSKLTANFCVRLPDNYRIQALMFTMENSATEEVLALYRTPGHYGYFLIRHPRGEQQEFWRQQAKNAEQIDENVENSIITVNRI